MYAYMHIKYDKFIAKSNIVRSNYNSITGGPSKQIFKEFMKQKEKAPTEIIVITGPMNDHIVPDDMESQQL